MIRKAYNCDNPDSFVCWFEGAAIFPLMQNLVADYGWRKLYFHAALVEITKHNECEVLMTALAEFVRLGQACIAAKRYAFLVVMGLVKPREEVVQDKNPKDIIHEFACDYVGEFIEKAFRAAIMEPLMVALRGLNRIGYMKPSELHALNVYAAVLNATVGIPVTIPCYRDFAAVGWTMSFLNMCDRPAYATAVKALLKPEHFGKSHTQVEECMLIGVGSVEQKDGYEIGKFVHQADGDYTKDAVYAAIDRSPSRAPERQQLATYLENFCGLFAREFFVPKFLSAVNQSRSNAMQKAFEEFLVSNPEIQPEDGNDYRYWIYDVMDGSMHLDRACSLLEFLHIIH